MNLGCFYIYGDILSVPGGWPVVYIYIAVGAGGLCVFFQHYLKKLFIPLNIIWSNS